ncbi:HNH endonuclease signature motif containing protein [soil metagenome]
MFDSEILETPPVSNDLLELSDAEWALLDLPVETGRPGFPAGLESLEPGPALGAILSTIDVSSVSGSGRVAVLRAHQRQASHYQAATYRDMAAISDYMLELGDDEPCAEEAAAFEIRAALRLTRRGAETELGLAQDLKHRFPAVGEALARGDIDVRRARTVAYGTGHLSDDDACQVVDRVIDRAPELTTGQLAALVRELCFAVDPKESKSRYEQALKDRRVYREATGAGTANLMILNAAPDRAAEASDLINHIALGLKTADEPRTLDQLRADVALDLLSGRANGRPTGKGTVDIHVDLTSLAELSEAPGDLAGYGPVIADIARQVAERQQRAEWRYTITDPDTGMVVDNGTTKKRRANSRQTRHVQARHRTCVSPGCRMPAIGCDLDHSKPYAETHHTTVDELAPLCRFDHCQRHKHGWTYIPIAGGDYLWTSRLGTQYTTSGRPPP